MSAERNPDTDSQSAPIPNDRRYIQDLVVADIETRKQFGIAKYGTALQAGNGRDMLLDAYEEALDLTIYLRGAIEERTTERPVVDIEILIGSLWCAGHDVRYDCPAQWTADALTVAEARADAARDGWTTTWRSVDGIDRPRLIDLCPMCTTGEPF